MSERLTELLTEAADSKPGAAERFFKELLESSVFVPLKAGQSAEVDSQIVGEKSLESLGYVIVHYQGAQTVPIFTENYFVSDWAGEETTTSEVPFRRLVNWIPSGVWIYLNPGQEVGKELTPWEIECLKSGVDSIPDLIAALDELEDDDTFIVNASNDLFSEFKSNIQALLETYSELEEAFLVSMKEGENGVPKPVLGIKYRGISEGKRIYLKSEFENASRELLPEDAQLMIVDDLENPNSPNHRIFTDATPFYYAPQLVRDLGEAGEDGAKSKLVNKLKSIFVRGSGE